MRISTSHHLLSRPWTLMAVVGATLWLVFFAMLGAAPRVHAGGDLAILKYVAAVNGAAPAEGQPIRVLAGDTIAYGLAVSSSVDLAGTVVTVTDVFGANSLSFENASVEACGSAGEEVSCTLDLDQEGAAEVTLTFSVLPVDGEGCQRLVNQATVESDNGSQAFAESEIEVCAEGAEPGTASESGAPAPAPSAGGGEVAGGGTAASPAPSTSGAPTTGGAAAGGGGTASVDTAVSLPAGLGSGLLVQLGALLVAVSAFLVGHAPGARR